jgi:hypothetical protein
MANKNDIVRQVLMAHACNPSYSGDWNQGELWLEAMGDGSGVFVRSYPNGKKLGKWFCLSSQQQQEM